MEVEDLARQAVDCGFRLHKDIGPGLLESVYEVLLIEALRERGLSVERQVLVPIRYKGVVVDNAFRVDLLVERTLIIELKSTERDSALFPKQLLTYLRGLASRASHELWAGNLQTRHPARGQHSP